MNRKTFGYADAIQDEIGIYIVCNDGTLMSVVNQLMKRKGFISISDTAGRHHYVVDGRINPMLAAKRFEDLIFNGDRGGYDMFAEQLGMLDDLDRAITLVLAQKSFDRTLIGTKLLEKLLRSLVKHGMTTNFKKMYAEAGKKYEMNSQQVERNIRYAIQKSDIWEDGMKNSKAFMLLEDEIRKMLE